MKHKRSYKEMSRDSKDHYGGLAGNMPDAKARERFKQPAYQVGRLIQEQGEQLEHKTVGQYLAEKYDMGGDINGQAKAEAVPGAGQGESKA